MSGAAEAGRQRALLQALQAGAPLALPSAALPLPGRVAAHPDAGLRAYRANAQAVAERALAAAYPVLAQLLGEETVAALARDLWQAHPPLRGDLAWFGAEAAAVLAGVEAFADMPWLADVARLEWAVHRAQGAADATPSPDLLQVLASADVDRVRVVFLPGSALVSSAWPVWTIWQAHAQFDGTGAGLQAAREALAAGRSEATWVWRRGLRVELALLDAEDAACNEVLLTGLPLGPALEQTLQRFPQFAFDRWLVRALREGWLAEFQPIPD